MSDPVSRFHLELLALGELDVDTAAAIRARMAEDPDLAERFARMERDLAGEVPLPLLELPADPQPGDVLPEESAPFDPDVEMPHAEPPPRSGFPRWASLGAVAAVLAAAVALFVLRPGGGPEVTFRGTLDLEVLRIRQGVAEPQGLLVKGRAGDRLQYRVRPSEGGFVSVFDVQDDGVVTVWKDAIEVATGGVVEGAAILDDYAGLERVYFVLSDEPVHPAAFERAVHDAWGPPLADLDTIPGVDATQRSVTVVEDP